MYLKQGVKKVTNERERERVIFAHLLTCDCLLMQGSTVFSEK